MDQVEMYAVVRQFGNGERTVGMYQSLEEAELVVEDMTNILGYDERPQIRDLSFSF